MSEKENEMKKRVAAVWQCWQKLVFTDEYCHHWNITMMRKVKGQAWCSKCERRTRLNAGRCYQYESKEEAQRRIEKTNEGYWQDGAL